MKTEKIELKEMQYMLMLSVMNVFVRHPCWNKTERCVTCDSKNVVHFNDERVVSQLFGGKLAGFVSKNTNTNVPACHIATISEGYGDLQFERYYRWDASHENYFNINVTKNDAMSIRSSKVRNHLLHGLKPIHKTAYHIRPLKDLIPRGKEIIHIVRVGREDDTVRIDYAGSLYVPVGRAEFTTWMQTANSINRPTVESTHYIMADKISPNYISGEMVDKILKEQ